MKYTLWRAPYNLWLFEVWCGRRLIGGLVGWWVGELVGWWVGELVGRFVRVSRS